MKTKDALTTAASKFIQNYKAGAQLIELFEKYAIEELELNKEEAKYFATQVESQQKVEMLDNDIERFYLWYYINYVAITDANRK